MASKLLKRKHILFIILITLIAVLPFRNPIRKVLSSTGNMLKGKATVAQRLEQYGETARQ